MLMYTHTHTHTSTDYNEQIWQLTKSLERESSEKAHLSSENDQLSSEIEELKQKVAMLEGKLQEKDEEVFNLVHCP